MAQQKISPLGLSDNMRAWARFDGTTAGINASYNITSITDNGVGDYYPQYATALGSSNYTAVASVENTSAALRIAGCSSFASSQLRVIVRDGAGAYFDTTYICFAVFQEEV